MKVCTHKGCKSRIQNNSVSGLCLAHYNAARARVKRFCAGCGDAPILTKNKSGLCQVCHNKARARTPRLCCECGIEIQKDSKTGRCMFCVTEYLYPQMRKCAHAGCRKTIQQTNVSGLCSQHRYNRRKPVLTDKTTLVVRSVGEAMGIHPRDILGLSQCEEIVEARAVVATILRRGGMSYPRIGERLGRDHSSVLNLVRRIPVYAERNPLVTEVLERAA